MAKQPANDTVAAESLQPSAAAAAAEEKESRFLSALQKMIGGDELADEAAVRAAIASLTPAQRRQLLSEGKDLKKDLMTKQEHADERNVYFNEVNRSADQAGLPVDKDGAFLAKKISEFMATSNDELPHLYVLEALSSSPYLVKATLCITELQALVTNGLWAPTDDECRSHMRTKLAAVGLKLPKISIQGHCSDSAPGERVKLTVTLTRHHAHAPEEMARLREATAATEPQQHSGQHSGMAAPAEAPAESPA